MANRKSSENKIVDKMVWSDRCREQFSPWNVATRNVERCDSIAEAGISELYPGYQLGRTNPRFHLMVYTEEGVGEFVTSRSTAQIQTGYVLIVPAGQPFGYVPLEGPWRFAWIHLPKVGRWAQLAEQRPVIRRSSVGPPINAAMVAFVRECRSHRQDSREASSLYAQLIVLHVERELGIREPQVVANHRAQLNGLWEMVAADVKREWTVEQMAREAKTSAPSLYRLCKKYAGTSPMKMVQRLRMEHAQELLVLHDHPVATIADMVGYTNEYAFAVAFKRFSGNTPAEFRKRR